MSKIIPINIRMALIKDIPQLVPQVGLAIANPTKPRIKLGCQKAATQPTQLDHWADDLKFGLEHGIKDIDQRIKDVRRQAKI